MAQGTTQPKPTLHIVTLGSEGHGKTTLAAAITKVQSQKGMATARSYADIAKSGPLPDRPPAISAACVEYESPGRKYIQVDCATYADHVNNMLTGTMPAGAILVVAATVDGIDHQAREHIALAHMRGLRRIVIFFNKCTEEHDAEVRETLEMNARQVLSKYNFDGDSTPVIFGAAQPALDGDPKWEAAIDKLIEALDSYVIPPVRDIERPFFMPVEKRWIRSDRDAMVWGRVERGVIKAGDEVELIGYRDTAKGVIEHLEMRDQRVDEGRAGDNLGCQLRGIEVVEDGQVLVKAGSMQAHKRFEGRAYIRKAEEGGRPLKNRSQWQFHIHTRDILGEVSMAEHIEHLKPGETAPVTVGFIFTPVPLEEGMVVEIRSRGQTFGVCVVTRISD